MALTIEDVKKRLLANPHVASVECTPVAFTRVVTTLKPGCVRDERFSVYAIEQEILREFDGQLDLLVTEDRESPDQTPDQQTADHNGMKEAVSPSFIAYMAECDEATAARNADHHAILEQDALRASGILETDYVEAMFKAEAEAAAIQSVLDQGTL